MNVGPWIVEARAGSNEALGRLLQGCRGYLLRVAAEEIDHALEAKGGASDIVQEAFLEAQRDFGRFTGDSEREWLAWLRRRVRYRASKFRREYRGAGKRATRLEVSLDEASAVVRPALRPSQPTPIDRLIDHERAERLHTALRSLPDKYRSVLVLRCSEGLSFGEIGDRTGRSENAARKLWHRAILRLAGELGQAAGD